MQVFVNKSDLPTIDAPIPVIAFYPDDTPMDRDAHGSNATNLCVDDGQIDQSNLPAMLKPSWRQGMHDTVNDEAQLRINEVFPGYMQQNANAYVNYATIKYGNDTATWPQAALDGKTACDTGWRYVADVRNASDSMGTDQSIIDPTDDSHWPPKIPPVYVPPTVP